MKSQAQHSQLQTISLSPLTQTLLQTLKTHPTPQSLSNKHFFKQLNLLILNSKPHTYACICDLTTSLQVQFLTENFKPLEKYDLNPWNKIENHYYHVSNQHDKFLFTLNCNDSVLSQNYGIKFGVNEKRNDLRGGMFEEASSALQQLDKQYEPHAYQPLYYFRQNVFDSFLKNRQNLTIPSPLQKIRITEWSLKIVNISKSNWYSIIIQIHKFKYLNQKVYTSQLIQRLSSQQSKKPKINLKNISSILYDWRFQIVMEEMRLVDVKRGILSEESNYSQDKQTSMCYHLRNVQTTHKLPKLSHFVTLDVKGEILHFDKKYSTHFIPIGNLQGICSFPQSISLKQPQKQEQLRELNAFSMRGLYQILNKEALHVNNKIKQKERERQWRQQRVGRQKIGENKFQKFLEERLENSGYRVQKDRKDDPSTFFSDDSDFWSNDENSKQMQEKQGEEKQDQDYVTKYASILNNPQQNNDFSSCEQEENEYFRSYREQMKKAFAK